MTYPIVLQDAFKRFTLDQDKILPPQETVRRFRRKLENLDLDILEDTRRIDNGRLGIPVYFSICGRDAAALTGTRKQMGKGIAYGFTSFAKGVLDNESEHIITADDYLVLTRYDFQNR